jgi:hypothetical protein
VHFRMPGSRARRVPLGAAAIGAVTALAAPALAGVTPGPAQTPAVGVRAYNTDMCGTSWAKIHIAKNSYYNYYNAPEGQAYTCLKVMRLRLDFQITKIDYESAWGYPNISSGWESGINSCAGVSGACFKYPVEEEHDGMPETSVKTALWPGTYNASYDIWFNKTDAHPVQDNGTEIMIWIAHPGISDSYSRYVTIEGIRFGVMDWTAYNARTKTHWHYVAYLALRQRNSVTNLWLNDFFRNAISNHELSPYWWLTGISFGFELVRGGLHTDVLSYSLKGVK